MKNDHKWQRNLAVHRTARNKGWEARIIVKVYDNDKCRFEVNDEPCDNLEITLRHIEKLVRFIDETAKESKVA